MGLAEVSLQGQVVHRRFEPLFANAAFAALHGYDSVRELLLQGDMLSLMDEETRADPGAAWARLATGAPVTGRRTLRKRDGSPLRAEVYARLIDWEGAPAVAMAILDVSAEEAAVRDLRAAEARARAAAVGKQRLLAAASHDLRTPLHAAMGRLQLLNDLSLGPKASGLSEAALRSCRVLLHQIDDILDAAALETGDAPLVAERFALRDALCLALETAQETLEQPSLALRLALAVGGPKLFIGDERRVRRIALALWEEGARRLGQGDLTLEVTAEPSGVSMRLRVEGGSMAQEPEAGAAPPLHIAERLAGAMNGSLELRRLANGDWEALAFLPLPVCEPEPVAPSRRLDILVVEDNAGNRALMKLVLEKLGHRAHLAPGGSEGLAAVAARPYDLVLMDLAMPGMDGFETARAIRRLDAPWAKLPIAALTASCGPGVQEAVAEAGMDAFLQKPVDLRRLAEAILHLAADASVHAAEFELVEHQHDHDEPHDQTQRSHA